VSRGAVGQGAVGRASWLALALALALAVGGCGGDGEPTSRVARHPENEPAQRGGSLLVTIPPVRLGLHPLQGDQPFQLQLWDCFFPRLFRAAPRGSRPPEFSNELAAWSTWRAPELWVGLRADRVWEDTTRVSNADVVSTFRAYGAAGLLRRWPSVPGGRSGAELDALVSVEAYGDSALRFVFRPEVAEWVAREIVSAPVMPAEWLERNASAAASRHGDGVGEFPSARGLMSGGPFLLPNESNRRSLALRANRLYEPRPWLSRVVIDPCPGSDARVLRMSLGRSDLAPDVPVHLLTALLEPRAPVDLHRAGIASIEMLVFRDAVEGGSVALDRRVREAISLAIDRESMSQSLLTWRRNVYGAPAAGWCNPKGDEARSTWTPPMATSVDSSGAVVDARLSRPAALAAPAAPSDTFPRLGPPRHDPVAARALLDGVGVQDNDGDGWRGRPRWAAMAADSIEGVAGVEIPLRVRIVYDCTNEFRERLLLGVERDLAAIGLEVEPIPVDGPHLVERLRAGLFDAALIGVRPPRSPDLSEWFASWGVWNVSGYVNAEVDGWARRVLSSDDPEEVLWHAQAIEARVRRDAIATPLVYREAVDLVATRVRGYEGDAADPLGPLAKAWLADTTEIQPDEVEAATPGRR